MDSKAQRGISIVHMPTGKHPEPGPLARRFSAHVRMIMARDRITAQALAESAGLSRSYVGKRLRDEAAFTLNDVEAISNALGIHLPRL